MFINRKRLEAISAVRTKIKESFQKKYIFKKIHLKIHFQKKYIFETIFKVLFQPDKTKTAKE